MESQLLHCRFTVGRCSHCFPVVLQSTPEYAYRSSPCDRGHPVPLQMSDAKYRPSRHRSMLSSCRNVCKSVTQSGEVAKKILCERNPVLQRLGIAGLSNRWNLQTSGHQTSVHSNLILTMSVVVLRNTWLHRQTDGSAIVAPWRRCTTGTSSVSTDSGITEGESRM